MIIEEGSKVEIFINGYFEEELTAVEDIEIVPNQLIMKIKHVGLISTNPHEPIEKLGDKYYKVNTWLQDAIGVFEGEMYKSIMDMG